MSSTTHNPARVSLSEISCKATGTIQWLLEKAKDCPCPPLRWNNLQVFMCGEEGFRNIQRDIEQAEHSVDIICWGFDPAMELSRDKQAHWPRGTTWGDLLRDAAAGRLKSGKEIQVRLLSWWSHMLGHSLCNMPGYVGLSDGVIAALGGTHVSPDASDPRGQRRNFNRRWFSDASNGRIPGLSLRTRSGEHRDVVDALTRSGQRELTLESAVLEWVATHHQKTIVIDYEGQRPLAYVMGLNSVTDYWDSTDHLFNDPRRGQLFEGSDVDHSVTPHWEKPTANKTSLKPYQDYACRIQGEAVAAVCKNFDEAWNKAASNSPGSGANVAPRVRGPLKSGQLPANLTQKLSRPAYTAQILRTQPDAAQGPEDAIGRLYHHAIDSARQYIYIENQYFQHPGWARALKEARQKHRSGCIAGGLATHQIPNLHLMVVTPTPERPIMVPRTAETLAELGQGDSVPDQDRMIKKELERLAEYEKDVAYYESKRADWQAQGQRFEPPRKPQLSELTQDYLNAGGDKKAEEVRETLQGTLGLNTLVASLWSCDANWRIENTETWRRVQAEKQRHASRVREQQTYGTATPPVEPLPDRSKDLRAAAAERYREVYIHSKLMVIDDSMFTLGSANLNVRSFVSDSEINVACDDADLSDELRQRVWGQHTMGRLDGGKRVSWDRERMAETFTEWGREAKKNLVRKSEGQPLTSFLVKFLEERTSWIRIG